MCIKIIDIFLTAALRNENEIINYNYDNTDVIALVEEDYNYGKKRRAKFIATFFTYSNISEMKAEHHKSGEFLKGKYFFFKNMVIIDSCCKGNIVKVVNHLIEEGEFMEVFNRL